MSWISLIFGAVVGFSLGLTGGGGAIFAVPLLVYGLGTPPLEAVGISLAGVGVTSLVGFVRRWRIGQVEVRTGMLFAVAGMLGAPVGAWIGDQISDALLMTLFAGFMLVVAMRLWRQASPGTTEPGAFDPPTADARAACRREPSGTLLLNSRCAAVLLFVGLLTGVLAGLFGVGGGLIIMPALLLFSSMPIQQAIGTSLLVITLISFAGVASHLAAGRAISLAITSLFVVGGVGGMFAGQALGQRISGPALQKSFALIIIAVALFVFASNWPYWP